MATANDLDNQGSDEDAYGCNNCQSRVETWYHCTQCEDFDLCVECYDKYGHSHQMVVFCVDLYEKRSNPLEHYVQSLVHALECLNVDCQLPRCQRMKYVNQHVIIVCNPAAKVPCPICNHYFTLIFYHIKHCQEVICPVPLCKKNVGKRKERETPKRYEASIRHNLLLIHANRCRNGNCRLPNCQKMKQLMQHTKFNEPRTNSQCRICMENLSAFVYHARRCTEPKCTIIHCAYLKQYLKHYYLKWTQLLRRRMAVVHMKTSPTVRTATYPSAAVRPASVQNSVPLSMPSQQHRCIPLPPPDSSLVITQVLKSYPQLVLVSFTLSQPHPPSIVRRWQVFLGDAFSRQPQPQQQQQLVVRANQGQGQVMQPVRPAGASLPPQLSIAVRNGISEILNLLNSPSSPDKQQNLLQILQRYPQLFAVFISER